MSGLLVGTVTAISPLTVHVYPSTVDEPAESPVADLAASDQVYILRRADTSTPVIMGKVT